MTNKTDRPSLTLAQRLDAYILGLVHRGFMHATRAVLGGGRDGTRRRRAARGGSDEALESA